MNKKANTVIFILVASVFNIILTVLCLIVLLLIFGKFIFPLLSENSAAWALPVMFVTSIVASALIYRLIIKVLIKKVDVEKYFDPIFSRRQSGKPLK